MIVDMKPKLISAMRLRGFEASRPRKQVVFLDYPFQITALYLYPFVEKSECFQNVERLFLEFLKEDSFYFFK